MLRGKTVLVTGSTSGIGLGIARAFAAERCNVMLNGLGEQAAIEALRADLTREFGVRVLHHAADMRRPAQIADMVREAQRELGCVDVLVNNAGIQHVAPVEEFPLDKWDDILAINLSSAFHAIRTALPAMRTRGWGRIINIASAHGLSASPFKAAYVAAKHGVVGLTKTVALESATHGVTCNAICPGFVQTPLVDKQIDDLARMQGLPRNEVITKLLVERQPTKQFVKIDDIAALAVFLAGDAAAGITGAALSIDGGWMAQ
jgi:3-hydroxybutyrate dehydrogenase